MARMACNFEKMAQLVEAETAKSLKQEEVINEKERLIHQLEERIATLECSCRDRAQQLTITQSKLELFESITTENERLKSDLNASKTEINDLKASVYDKEYNLIEMTKSERSLRGQNTHLKNLLQREQSSNEQANALISTLTDEVNMLKDENSNYKAARALFVQSTEDSAAGIEVCSTPRILPSSNTGSSKRKKRKSTETTMTL
jgi:chromosome segregation ATPase